MSHISASHFCFLWSTFPYILKDSISYVVRGVVSLEELQIVVDSGCKTFSCGVGGDGV